MPVDSVFLRVSVNRISGKSDVGQTINVYAMRDSIKRDSVYKMGTPDLLGKVDLDKPLFSFELKGHSPENGVKLTPTEYGRDFIQRLVDVPVEVYKEPWPEFHKEFYGLYFTPAPGEEPDAGLYEISINEGSSGFALYFHNHDPQDPEQNLDTTFVAYDFRSVSWFADRRVVNTHVNDVQYTYPQSIEEKLDNFAQPLTTAYSQSLGGIVSCLKATDELKNWFTQAKAGYSDMVIHSVRLDIPLTNTVGQNKELLPLRLGMYYRYATGLPMPDYNYTLEESSNSYSGMTIPYGGYFNVADGGYYRMDITQWLSQLMLDPTNTPQDIWLGPEIDRRANMYAQAAFDIPRAKLIITYTLIR